jgi:hypothetical protein
MEQLNVENDVLNINVPELIRSKQYFQYVSMIKNVEDTLQKVLANKSVVEDEQDLFIWNISSPENSNLFPNLSNIDLAPFEMEFTDSLDNVVVCGPYIRSCLVKNIDDHTKYAEVRKELYLYRMGDVKWSDLTDLSNFTDKKNEFVFDDGDRKIYLMKKKYKSISHIILQNDYLKRCGWYNGSFYVSSMFLIEIQKHINLLIKNFKDPILGHPYDPLEIYQITNKDRTHPVKIVDSVDCEELTKISPKNITKLFNSKTCIEMCIDKIMKEDKIILQKNLKHMIFLMCCHKYKRPPYLYAKLVGFDKLYPDLFKLVKSIQCEYDDVAEIDFVEFKNSIEDINTLIILYLAKKDDADNFFDFLVYTKRKIDKIIVNEIIKFKSLNITKQIITNSLVDNNLAYYLVLMTESLNSTKLFKDPFDMDLAFNYLKDILEGGKVKSFYWLYDSDKSIINTIFEDGSNILHNVRPNGNYKDLIKLILKLKPDLLNVHNTNKETPLIYHAKYNPTMLDEFIEYEFNSLIRDKEGNIFLHHLCKTNNVDILKKFLKRCPEIINMPNSISETPIIISCKYNMEESFCMLKMFGADLEASDHYGNTVYHYICANSMCIGMLIDNKKNHFGLTPLDYCKISPSYYGFQ